MTPHQLVAFRDIQETIQRFTLHIFYELFKIEQPEKEHRLVTEKLNLLHQGASLDLVIPDKQEIEELLTKYGYSEEMNNFAKDITKHVEIQLLK